MDLSREFSKPIKAGNHTIKTFHNAAKLYLAQSAKVQKEPVEQVPAPAIMADSGST